jgi:adenylate cyclase class IV
MWCIYTMKYYSTIKQNKISFVGKWIEVEIMLNEIKQTERDKYQMFSHVQKLSLM